MSAEDDRSKARAEYSRGMQVRRIAGGIQIATGIFGIILFGAIVIVTGNERLGIIAFIALTVGLVWFAADGPADRLAARIEAWLSSPP